MRCRPGPEWVKVYARGTAAPSMKSRVSSAPSSVVWPLPLKLGRTTVSGPGEVVDDVAEYPLGVASGAVY